MVCWWVFRITGCPGKGEMSLSMSLGIQRLSADSAQVRGEGSVNVSNLLLSHYWNGIGPCNWVGMWSTSFPPTDPRTPKNASDLPKNNACFLWFINKDRWTIQVWLQLWSWLPICPIPTSMAIEMDPKLEVPTICKAYVKKKTQNRSYLVQYLYFRILKLP